MIETSRLTKERIASYLMRGKRFDNRSEDEFREIKVEVKLSNKAEGSAKVNIGKTEVWVGVKMDVGEPYPDSPDKGNLIVTAELLPLSHYKYEYGPPKFDAIELGRLVDRGIRESKYIDFSKLCIKEGEKVWNIYIDIYSINDDGNLLDAAFIGTLASLKSAMIPHYNEKEEKVDYEKPAKEKLPLTERTPLNYSIYKIGERLLLDPVPEEEAASEGKLVLAVVNDKPLKICSMQKGEKMEISIEKFEEMMEFVEKHHKNFFPKVMKIIDDAIKKRDKEKV
ncbi:MAG: exosome complex protein Rrp42 [Candidatus Pacearchaeota archaeon]